MTITLGVFTIVLILFIMNIILEHLFNWWFRTIKQANDENVGTFALFAWVAKTIVLIALLHSILT